MKALPRRQWHCLLLVGLLSACNGGPPASTEAQQESTGGVQVPASNLQMAARLSAVAQMTPAGSHPFRNRERADAQERAGAANGSDRERFELAFERLRAGDTERAIELLEELLAGQETQGTSLVGLPHQTRSALAMAYLRLGEQRNCLESINSASCLLPLPSAGQHADHAPSRRAIELFEEALEDEPNNLQHRWLLNIAAMTVGEYPTRIAPELLIEPSRFEGHSAPDTVPWPNVSALVGLDAQGLAGGVVVDDLDGDGLLDVLFSSWGSQDPLRFFRAASVLQSDGKSELHYEEVQTPSLEGITGGLHLISADYDNDGDVDVFVLRGAWLRHMGRLPNSLLRNDGDFQFTDVTEELGLLSFHPTQTAAWADVNGDGWLDLFIGNESVHGEPHQSELFISRRNSEGQRHFVDEATSAGIAVQAFVKGAAFGDFNSDGQPDLVLSVMNGPNRLFENISTDSTVLFREHPGVFGDRAGADFSTWVFDYDQDGDDDLFFAGYSASFRDANPRPVIQDYVGQQHSQARLGLYRNNGGWKFEDVSREAGLEVSTLAMSGAFGDTDNDGFLDFYLGTGAPDFGALVPNRMFRNRGDGVFEEVTAGLGVGHLQKGHGISFADLDHDGDQDIVTVMGGAFSGDVFTNAVFENPGSKSTTGASWLQVELDGSTSNRSGLGAKLKFEVLMPSGQTRSIHRSLLPSGSFGSTPRRLTVGLGQARALTNVRVLWPEANGQWVDYGRQPMFCLLRLRQDGAAEEVTLEPHSLSSQMRSIALHTAH